jgi:GMP synthase (glutamine-hydrolysing)
VSDPRPFLLLQVRPEEAARDRELDSMRSASGLGHRLERLRVDTEPLPDDVFERYAGFLVGGSPFNVTDPEEGKGPGQRRAEQQLTRLAEQALERDHPAFFTCYGIGVLTRALGGVVDRSRPERVSAALNRLTDAGAADPIAGALSRTFFALTGHKEAAPEPPPDAVLLATNDVSPVQLYRVGNVYASQFHPEPTTQEFVERATAYSGYGYFREQELAAIAAQVLATEITEPRRLLTGFVERYGA